MLASCGRSSGKALGLVEILNWCPPFAKRLLLIPKSLLLPSCLRLCRLFLCLSTSWDSLAWWQFCQMYIQLWFRLMDLRSLRGWGFANFNFGNKIFCCWEIQDLGPWIQNPGCMILYPSSRTQDQRSLIQDPRPWILDPGSWIQDTRSRVSDSWLMNFCTYVFKEIWKAGKKNMTKYWANWKNGDSRVPLGTLPCALRPKRSSTACRYSETWSEARLFLTCAPLVSFFLDAFWYLFGTVKPGLGSWLYLPFWACWESSICLYLSLLSSSNNRFCLLAWTFSTCSTVFFGEPNHGLVWGGGGPRKWTTLL